MTGARKDVRGAMSRVLPLLMLFLVGTGCTVNDHTNLDHTPTSPRVFSPSPSILSTQTAADTPTPQCESELVQVTTHAASLLGWSDNGMLFYRLEEDTSVWAFDPAGQISTQVSAATVPITPEPPLEISRQITGNDQVKMVLAPSGDRAIYGVELSLVTSPTLSNEGIPSGTPPIVYDLYLVETGRSTPTYLGRIDGVVNEFAWLPDEAQVLVTTIPQLPGSGYAWLADISTYSLLPFISTEPGGPIVPLGGLSPDGERVLCEVHYPGPPHLCLKDIADGTETRIFSVDPNSRYYFWWSSDSERLIVVDDIDRPLIFSAYVLDLQADELYPASSLTFTVAEIALSPDQTRLAIIRFPGRQLELLTLCAQVLRD